MLVLRLVLALVVVSAAGARSWGSLADSFVTPCFLESYNPATDQGSGHGTDWTVTRLRFNAQGTAGYAIAGCGPDEAPWEIIAVRPVLANIRRVTNNARNEFAVVPSPDEKTLLLLAEVEGGLALIVADTQGRDLAPVATGLDVQRSQFAWSHDGAFIYYTAPVPGEKKIALYRVTPDGKTSERLLGDDDGAYPGVDEFDVCRTRDRVIVRTGNVLRVLDEKKAALTFAPESQVEGVRLSPDGAQAAWGAGRLEVVDLETRKVVAATSPPRDVFAADAKPAWSIDGRMVAFERTWRLGGADGLVMQGALGVLTVADASEKVKDPTRWRLLDAQWLAPGQGFVYEKCEVDLVPVTAYPVPPAGELIAAPEGAAWQACAAPPGGWVTSFKVAPTDGRIVYAIVEGRVYFTEDAGDHWRCVAEGFDDVAIDPKDARVLYGTSGGSLRRSMDGGETWDDYGPTMQNQTLHALCAHPSASGVVYAIRWEGALSRLDAESETELAELGGPPVWAVFRVDARNPDVLFYRSVQGPWRLSTDGGKTWQEITRVGNGEDVVSLAVSPDEAGVVLASCLSGRVYYSDNGGADWDLYGDPAAAELWTDAIERVVTGSFALVGADAHKLAAEVGWPTAAKADPQDRRRIYTPAGELGLWRSDDGGLTWKSASSGLGIMYVQGLVADPAVAGRLLAVSASSQVLVRADADAAWESIGRIARAGGTMLAVHPGVPGLVLACSTQPGLQRSTDGGATWEHVGDGPAQLGMGDALRFQFDASDARHVVLCALKGVLESSDAGKHWRRVTEFESPYDLGMDYACAAANGEVVSVAAVGGRRIFQTRDGGKTWRLLEGPYQLRPIVALVERPGVERGLLVLGDRDRRSKTGLLCVSSDLGETWEARPVPATWGNMEVLAQHPLESGTLAAGTSGGAVIVTFDEGRTWHDCRAGLPDGGIITRLAFSPADNRLYAFLQYFGLYWIELPKK